MSNVTMSVNEMATALGVSRPTAYALARMEGFPIIRIGRRLRVSAEGLKAWVRENEGRQVLEAVADK